MSLRTVKIARLAAALLLFALCARPPSSGADPYSDRLALKSAVSVMTKAILREDIDALMELSLLAGTFQFDKRDRLNKFMQDYFNVNVVTEAIEPVDLNLISDQKAEATVRVHIVSRRYAEQMNLQPREKVWSFVKGEKGPKRGKWLFVLE